MCANSVYSRKKYGRQRKYKNDSLFPYFSIWTSLISLVIEIWLRMVWDAVDENVLHNSNMNVIPTATFYIIVATKTLTCKANISTVNTNLHFFWWKFSSSFLTKIAYVVWSGKKKYFAFKSILRKRLSPSKNALGATNQEFLKLLKIQVCDFFLKHKIFPLVNSFCSFWNP